MKTRSFSLMKRLTNRYLAACARAERQVELDRIAAGHRPVKEPPPKLPALRYPSWVDVIVKPIGEELRSRYPERKLEVLGPAGLAQRATIYLDGPTDTMCLTLEPVKLREGRLGIVDFSRDTGDYQPGTVGHLNGLNHPAEPVPKDADAAWFASRLTVYDRSTA